MSPPLTFQRALREHAVVRLLAWEAQERTPRLETPAAAMRSLHPDADGAAPEVSIFIGPEGGFEQREVNAAIAAGCHLVSLGPNILRAETAAVAALAMLTAAWQEQRESDRR